MRHFTKTHNDLKWLFPVAETDKEEIQSPFDEDIQIFNYVKENKDMFFTT